MSITQSKYGRRFDEEFKREVAALASRPGAKQAQVARDPGVSRPANRYDNARMESFWATLKTELIGAHVFVSPAEAKSALFDYIEVFYNRRRLHSAFGFQSPVDHEYNLS